MHVSDVCSRLDLVFVVDSSGSINKKDDQNWGHILSFMNTIVDNLVIGTNDVHVGLIKYGNNAEVMFKLDRYTDAGNLKVCPVPTCPLPCSPSSVYVIKEKPKTLTGMDSILPPSDRHAA